MNPFQNSESSDSQQMTIPEAQGLSLEAYDELMQSHAIPAEIADSSAEPLDSVAIEPEAETETEASEAEASEHQCEQTLCPQCEQPVDWNAQSWCVECGYFPKFGMKITTSQQADEGPTEASLKQVFPAWMIVLLVGCVAICALTIATTGAIADSSMQFYLGLTQLSLGISCFLCAHTWAYISGLQETDKVGMGEMLLKPFQVWTPTIKRLPETSPRLWFGAWSMTAALAAMVFGGISPLAFFLNSNMAAAPSSLRSAARAAEQASSGEGNLTQSVAQAGSTGAAVSGGGTKTVSNQFASQGQISGTNGEGTVSSTEPPPQVEPAKTIYQTDCVVIGYTLSSMTKLQSLLLAAEINGRLKFVGLLKGAQIPQELHSGMIQQLQKIGRKGPLVITPYRARWVNAQVAIRVQHEDWTPSKRLVRPEFGQQLMGL